MGSRSIGYFALATIWFAAESKKPGYGGRAVNRPSGRQFNRGLQTSPVPGEVFIRLDRPVRRVKRLDTL